MKLKTNVCQKLQFDTTLSKFLFLIGNLKSALSLIGSNAGNNYSYVEVDLIKPARELVKLCMSDEDRKIHGLKGYKALYTWVYAIHDRNTENLCQ